MSTPKSRRRDSLLAWALSTQDPDIGFNGLRIIEHIARCRSAGDRSRLLATIVKIPAFAVTLDALLAAGVVVYRRHSGIGLARGGK